MTRAAPAPGDRQPLLQGRGLVKTYGEQYALAQVDVRIDAGEVLAVVGPSGSGKTTLLHVLAGILPPDEGEVLLDGHRTDRMGEAQRSKLRRTEFGFVFQSGMLVAELSAEENAALPMLLAGVSRRQAVATARGWLDHLGLAGKEHNRPGELSGGQAQRVAIARALGHQPKVLFADEPTGALDSRTGEETMRVLTDTASRTGAAIVYVTHDRSLAERAGRAVTIHDGHVLDGVVAR